MLGPLEVEDDGLAVVVPGRKERAILVTLALHARHPVSTDALVELLWGEPLPDNATRVLQTHVFRLRRAMAPRAIVVTRTSAYVLDVPDDEVDAVRFERILKSARAQLSAGDVVPASNTFSEALALWRTDEVAPVADTAAAHAQSARLNELRIAALEDRFEADLAAGRHVEVVADLEALAAVHPHRERLWGHLVLAQYRSGRQADALRTLQRLRCALRETGGVVPSSALRRLEAAVLAQDPALGSALSVQAGSGRKLELAAATKASGFFGRTCELRELTDAFDAASAGRGSFFVVTGEPGIGKTRLVESVAAVVQPSGGRVAWGSSWEGGGAPPFWPWIQVVRALLPRNGETGAQQAGVSSLGSLLPAPGLPDGTTGPTTSDDARFALFDATSRFLHRAAADSPLLLVIDDVHAADTPSVALLEFVVRHLRDAAILVVATSRDVEARLNPGVCRSLDAASRSGRRLVLRGLSEDDVGSLILRTSDVAASPAAVAQIHRKTGGNPLFVDELVRLMISEGVALTSRDGALKGPVTVPDGVRETIRRRTAPLSAEAREILATAAVIGRDFDLGVVQAACCGSHDKVLKLVQEAATLDLVDAVPGSPTSYRFGHALTRDAIYHGLTSTARASAHHRVAQALESMASASVSELAHHFRAAAPVVGQGPAIRYSIAAAEQALADLAYEDAVVEYRRALDALALKPGADPLERCRLLLAATDACRPAGDHAQRSLFAREAASLASHHADSALLAEAAQRLPITGSDGEPARGLLLKALSVLPAGPSRQRVRLLRQLAQVETNSVFHDRAPATIRQALVTARDVGDPELLIETLGGMEFMLPYQPDEHRAIADELEKVAADAGSDAGMVLAHRSRIRQLLHEGDLTGFDAERDHLAQMARRLRQAPLFLAAERWTFVRLLLAGRFEEADRLLPELLAMSDGVGDPLGFVMTFHLRMEQGRLEELEPVVRRLTVEFPQYAWRPRLAALLAERGHVSEAREQLDELAQRSFADVRPDLAGFVLPLLAEVAAVVGDRPRAELLCALLGPLEGRCVVVGGSIYACLGAVSRHLGVAATALGRWEAAEHHLSAALERHRRMASPPLVARTLHDLAALFTARGGEGDAERASSLAADCLRIARKLGMARLVDNAKPLLARPTHSALAVTAVVPGRSDPRPDRDRIATPPCDPAPNRRLAESGPQSGGVI